MSLIRYLALFGGTGMLAAAAGMLGLDWYLLGKTRGQLVARLCPIRGDWCGRVALALLGWGAMLLAVGFIAFAGGDSR